MSGFLFIFLVTAVIADRGPPKLLYQPPEEVWLPLVISPQAKPVLKCVGSDNVDNYEWRKNGEPFTVGGNVEWERPGQTGSIVFKKPSHEVAGYYQCFASNIFGTAVSNRAHVQIGVLDHFPSKPIRKVPVVEGESLTLDCSPPRGTPSPTIFWLYRDTEQDSVIETIRRRHIAVDPHGKLHFSAVQKHDGRPNLLYECAATSPVLHGEYRAGDQIQLEVTPKEYLAPIDIHPMYTSPSEVTVKAGGRLKIQCIFGGFPVPTVFWSKLDGELPKDRMKSLTSSDSDFGKSLIVDNVHPDDAGRYECRAQNISHTVNVRVLAAPFWEENPPEDVVESEDNSAELHCLVGGSPPPIIRWSMNGIPLHELPEISRRMLLDGGRLLRLPELHHEVDTGVYQCNASNPLGYVFANAFVHVRAHAPRFLMPVDRIIKAILRTTVYLNCEVDAAPEAVVRWVDADDRPLQIIEGKSKLLPNHTLVIYDVNSADEGIFYCNTSNKYGINRATIQLRVYKPTYFVKVPTPRTLFLEAGRDAELVCEAVADPRLEVEYKWTINGNILNNSRNFEILPDRLKIRKARGRHSGTIDCAAVTEVDVKLASVNVVVKDVPSNPEMEVPVCTERKAVIRWKASNPHGDPVLRYIVEVQTDFKKGVWEILTEETSTEKTEYEVDVTLTPWVNYTFRVVSRNTHGRSDVGLSGHEPDPAPVIKCQTRASSPYTNPSGVWAAGTQPDNLVIHWNPMDKYYWNGPGLNYLIRYKLNDAHSAWSEFLVEDPLASSTAIRELPTFREYLVQVRAVNSKGPSILEPETIKGFSGEDVPSAEPGSFRLVQVINYTTAEFSWVPVDKDNFNGYFEGYEIEYWKTDYPQRKYKILVPAGRNSKNVTTFSANTNYSAVIRTKNKQYVSGPSRLVRFETPEGVPSKVSNMKVFAVGAHSILVSWDKPQHPNGILRGYFLSFENDRNETEETFVLHKLHHYLHERSLPDTGYKVSVWAETSAGEGPRTMKPLRTWPLRPPDPPFFKVSNVTLDSMIVTWIPSNGTARRMSGSSFYVNYTLEGSGIYQQSTEVILPETQMTIRELADSSKYILVGVAKDGPGMSQSEPIPVFTARQADASHLNQESLRTAAWFVAVLLALAVALIVVMITCCCEERKAGGYSVRRKELEVGHQLAAEEERRFLEYQYGYKS